MATTVDGQEPNIRVRFVGSLTQHDGTAVLRLHNDDEGVPREIRRGGDPVLVTGDEFRLLSAYEVEQVTEGEEGEEAEAGEEEAQTGEDTSPQTPANTPLTPTGASTFGRTAPPESSQQSTTPGTTG